MVSNFAASLSGNLYFSRDFTVSVTPLKSKASQSFEIVS